MVQVLCGGTRVNAPHRRSDAQDDLEGVPHVPMDCGFLGERESEEHVSPELVIRERRHKMTWAMLVPRKGTEFPWIAKRAARFIDQLGHNTVTLRCDNEPGEGNRTSSPRRWSDCSREAAGGRQPVQWGHRTCGRTRCQPGQNIESCVRASHRNQNPT